jgi:hypothetical protein
MSDLDKQTLRAISYHNVTYDYYIHYPKSEGGRLRCKTIHGVFVQDGIRYRYKCDMMGRSVFRIRGGLSVPCFLLILNPENDTAHLQEIIRQNKCLLEPGLLIQKAAKVVFQIAREYGVRRIELSDLSTKILPTGKKFKLSLMSF